MTTERCLIIACGALARELRLLIAANGFAHVDLVCLPATLHNRPELIADAVRDKIEQYRQSYAQIFCAYADCGTGGDLDRALAGSGVVRIAGPHCYAFFAGQSAFAALAEAEPGTLYLTDFLVRQFDTLVIRSLGLDRHPELQDLYFGNYRRLVYLEQTPDAALLSKARQAAERLGLGFEHHQTGMGELAQFVRAAGQGTVHGRTDHRLVAGHSGTSDRPAGPQVGETSTAGALRASYRPRRDARRSHRNRRLS